MNIRSLIFIVCFCAFCAFNVQDFSQAQEQNNCLFEKKIVMVIASQKFHDTELFVPLTFFKENEAQVDIASTTVKEVKGMLGKTVFPDKLLTEIDPAEYDAIVFIGGSGASEYFDNPQAHQLISQAVKQGKIVGAICIAPMTLAYAGVLETKRATVWPGMADDMAEKCNIYTGKDVESDGNIITANGPQSALKFAEAIKMKLCN